MKVSLDGLARNIKAEIRGPRRDEMAFMVDEMVRWLKELEAENKRLQRELDEIDKLAPQPARESASTPDNSGSKIEGERR